jgi:mannose-6-phosphate isomerase-like protein (cupin superfamily)
VPLSSTGEKVVQISRRSEASTTYEYGCDLRRLYPWQHVADPLWGSAIASVRPREATTPHSHDEDETFIIMHGHGEITVDGRSETMAYGDVVFLPRNSYHTIRNLSATERLDFITIFWGSPESDQRMFEMARKMAPV